MSAFLAFVAVLAMAQVVMWEQRRPRPHPYEPKHAKG